MAQLVVARHTLGPTARDNCEQLPSVLVGPEDG
jgi:hypothetical protein